MNALIKIDAPSLPALSGRLNAAFGAADSFSASAEAPQTRRVYISAFRAFRAWCEAHDLLAMPAQPEVVSAYIAERAAAGLRPSSLQREIASIKYAHRLANQESPTDREHVKRTMRGIRRTVGAAQVKKKAATAGIVSEMLDACRGDTLKAKRDRALLCLGFSGAFRRSELVALNLEDLTFGQDGLRIIIRRSKTDQEGAGRELLVPHGSRIRPVEAVREWLDAAGIESGPVFRSISKSGRVSDGALGAKRVAILVQDCAKAIGRDPAEFGAHSLRAGFVTSAVEAGARIDKIKEVSRHRSTEVLLGYVRSADLAKDHSGASFL